MRQRRAERCRLRAESAIDEGAMDDAQEALDEARRLQPDLPGRLVVEERLVEARIPRITTQPAAWRTGRTLAAAASIALVASIGALTLSGRPLTRLRPTPVLSTAPSPTATFSNPVEQIAPTIDRSTLTQAGSAASNRSARTDALAEPSLPASAADPQSQPEVPAEPAVEPPQPLVIAAPAIVLPAPNLARRLPRR